MANKRIIELNERTTINMGDFLMVDDATGSRKLAMSTLFNYLTYSSLMFVDTLPTTDIDPTVIYLVPHSGSTTQWDEYIYRDNQWILIGTSTLDLSSIYQTKTDNSLQTTSKQVVGAINEINTALTRSAEFVYAIITDKVTVSSSYYSSLVKTLKTVTLNVTLDNTNALSTGDVIMNLPEGYRPRGKFRVKSFHGEVFVLNTNGEVYATESVTAGAGISFNITFPTD